MRRDTVVIIDLLSLAGELVGGQPCSQDTLDGNEWRPIVSEISSAVGDAVCAVAELSFELEAAIVDDDASEVGDEIGFAGNFGVHGGGLRKRTRRSEDVERRDGKADLERDAEGKRTGNNKVSRGRRRKRVKNEDKHSQNKAS
jgi:hypothetical protein